MKRRSFITIGSTISAVLMFPSFTHSLSVSDEKPNWNTGSVAHIIPTASHDKFLIKKSFHQAVPEAQLKLGKSRFINRVKTDQDGRFWYFDVPGLQADTSYDLQLAEGGKAKTSLCDNWPQKTFSSPDAKSQMLRILIYTCAGGYDAPPFKGKTAWLDMNARKQLFPKAISFNPDIVIANGNHI